MIIDTGATAGNIAFASTISGAQALDLRAGAGTITLSGAAGTGSLTPLSSLSGVGISITLAGVKTTANQSYTADTLTLNGDLSGAGTLTLQPVTPSRSIGLGGGAGSFSLGDTALGHLLDGFTLITIGRADGQHAIDVQSAAFRDPVIIQTPAGGSITVNGAIITGGDNDASVKLTGPVITLNAGITTVGHDITLMGPTTLGANVGLSTGSGSAGDISFTSTLDGNKTLGLTAGSGNITFGDNVGAGTPLGAVTINEAGNVQANGSFSAASLNQAVAGSGTVSFHAITTAGAANTAGGIVTLNTAGTLTISGPVDTRGGIPASDGKAGGAVSLTGGDVAVAAINSSGSDAVGVNNDGGAAGAISINATRPIPIGVTHSMPVMTTRCGCLSVLSMNIPLAVASLMGRGKA